MSTRVSNQNKGYDKRKLQEETAVRTNPSSVPFRCVAGSLPVTGPPRMIEAVHPPSVSVPTLPFFILSFDYYLRPWRRFYDTQCGKNPRSLPSPHTHLSDGVLSAKAVWTRPRMDSAPVFQWVSISSRTGTALLTTRVSGVSREGEQGCIGLRVTVVRLPLEWPAPGNPAASFDPPYEENHHVPGPPHRDGRDGMNMREFRNEDRIFLNADPAYASGVHNFRRYKVNQMERTPEGLAIPKELLKDIAAETALAAEYLCATKDEER
ncbi:hypothetical protein C8F01DRAFT_1086558 [Mycena amicta]|nr:hypothetical protein C8F01DRAFT_1086558 [Mycena amicta]